MTTSAEISREDIQELVWLEENMWREITRFDPVFQNSKFAPDFFEFGRSGNVYSRSEVVLMEASPILAKLPLANLTIRKLDLNTAQITYDSEVISNGRTEYARRSSIWSKTVQGWVIRFHQGTPYIPS